MKEFPKSTSLVLRDGKQIDLGPNCSIGRTPDNDIILDGEDVSRRHAIIHQQAAGEYCLIDLGSSNGTFLNDRLVIQPVLVEDEDVISIGGNRLAFRVSPGSSAPSINRVQADSTVKRVMVLEQWLLVADLAGFTRMSRSLPANELARAVGSWFLECGKIIETHRGQIHKYLGDGFLAVWPDVPDTIRNISRTLEEFRALQDRGGPLFRLALHFGKVTQGKLADGGEIGIMGPEVNFLFRMEKLAAKLSVDFLLSDQAADALRQAVALRELGRFPVRGFDGEYTFFAWEPD